MPERKATKSDEGAHVSEQQQTAIVCIVAGQNLQTVADTLGVARTTVSRWLNHDAHFQASLNQHRMQLWNDLVDRLRSLAPKAVEVLARELEGDTPMPAALAILRACGLASGGLAPSGPTTPEEAAAVLQVQGYEAQHAQAETQVELERRARELALVQMTANPLAALRDGLDGRP
jgi:hypothetical protein